MTLQNGSDGKAWELLLTISSLRLENRTINLERGKLTGTFLVLLENGGSAIVLVAVAAPGYKPGTPFGLEERSTGKSDKVRVFYRPYESLYTLLRGYRDRVKSWVTANLQTVRKFRTLAATEMLGSYGVVNLYTEEFAVLQSELRPFIYEDSHDGLSRTRRVTRAIELFKRNRTRLGTRNVLGDASVLAGLQYREDQLERIDEVVVSVSTMVADFLDSLMVVIRAIREKLDAIVLSDEFISPAVAGELEQIAVVLGQVLIFRPHTHVGKNARLDCEEACSLIRSLLAVSASGRTGATEGIRNLIVAARNSLIILERQYEIEGIITYLSNNLHAKARLSEEEWRVLVDAIQQLFKGLPDSLGNRFTRASNPLPNMRIYLQQAISVSEDARQRHSELDPGWYLGEAKDCLTRASLAG